MSYRTPFAERERVLEDAFFRQEEDRKRAERRASEDRAERAEALARVLGPRDPALIDPLVDLGFDADNATALVLAPLVALAWADRRLDPVERQRILRAELELGIDPEGDAGRLVLAWLERRPSGTLLDAWSAYVTALCRVLDASDRDRLRDEIVDRAYALNRTTSRTLLRGAGPSRVEREVLRRIEDAFQIDGGASAAVASIVPDPADGGLDEALQSLS